MNLDNKPVRWPSQWFHGSPSGELKGSRSGIHVGSQEAARQALGARIGYRADGKDWDGTQEYGKTLLAGKTNLKARGRYLCSGYNCWAPDEDYYPTDRVELAKYSDGTPVAFDSKPVLRPVKIKGPMLPHCKSDGFANTRMRAQLKRNQAKRGYYYKNDAEDFGSISAVVPTGAHLESNAVVTTMKSTAQKLIEAARPGAIVWFVEVHASNPTLDMAVQFAEASGAEVYGVEEGEWAHFKFEDEGQALQFEFKLKEQFPELKVDVYDMDLGESVEPEDEDEDFADDRGEDDNEDVVYDDRDDDDPIDGVGFARDGSALRAATDDNPRDLPCPHCGEPNVLTRIDRLRGYKCDRCADRAEGKGFLESTVNSPDYWREQGDEAMAGVKQLEQELEAEFPQLQDLDLAAHTNGSLHIASIRVKPGHAGQGIGSQVMRRIQSYAKQQGLPITLTPQPDRGHKADLHRFYRSHGFWKNKGRRADYRYTSPFAPTMLWKPKLGESAQGKAGTGLITSQGDVLRTLGKK